MDKTYRVYSRYTINLRDFTSAKAPLNGAKVRAGQTFDIEKFMVVDGIWWTKVRGGWFRLQHGDGRPRTGVTLYSQSVPIDLFQIAEEVIKNGRN